MSDRYRHEHARQPLPEDPVTAPRTDPWWMTAVAVTELTLWLALACLLVLAGALGRGCRALRRRRES